MSCLRLRVGSTRLHPPGLTLQIEGPGCVASPTRYVSGTQPIRRYPRPASAGKLSQRQSSHRFSWWPDPACWA
eukprot:428948-Amphidinium_carterae.1